MVVKDNGSLNMNIYCSQYYCLSGIPSASVEILISLLSYTGEEV